MAYQDITKYNSPNYTPARSVQAVFGRSRKITALTIHHWGVKGQNFYGVVNYLCRAGGTTSAHYVVQDGLVACIVDPDDAAWHSGSSVGNATTIGIELRPEATAGDYQTAAELIADLRKVYGDVPLKPHNYWYNTSCPGDWSLSRLDSLARTLKGSTTKVTTAKVIKKTTKAAAAVKKAVTPKKKTYVTLPASAAKWGIYKQGARPVAANIFHYLTPAQFGGLTYEVKGWTVPNQVALIDTGVKGRVQIYVAPGTGARIFQK